MNSKEKIKKLVRKKKISNNIGATLQFEVIEEIKILRI